MGRGCASVERLVALAGRGGHGRLAVTDVNGLYGATAFARQAEKAGIQPIIGAELRSADGAAVTALVSSQIGYENLCQLITRIHADDLPIVLAGPTEEGDSAAPDGLQGLGDEASERDVRTGVSPIEIRNSKFKIEDLSAGLHLITEDPSLAADLLGAGIAGDRLWLELDPATQPVMAVRRLQEASSRLGVGLLATGRAMMAEAGDAELARLLAAIRLGRCVDQIGPGDCPHPRATLRSAEQLRKELADFPAAMVANQRLAQECSQFRLLPQQPVFPQYPCPPGQSSREHLRQLCLEGMRWRYGLISPAAQNRLHRELDLIERKGFSEYFLVVRDIVQYARAMDAPIAGRGSGASSLVAYVLGITNICPLAFDIPFERFLNERRVDFPDLDIDFCWRIRDDVIRYAFRRWGGDHVAMVSMHSLFQERSAFRETAKAFGMSEQQVTRLRLAGSDSGGRVGRIVSLAQRIVGLPHNLSVHPGGIVIGRKPISHYVPVQPALKGVMITQYDKDGVEDIGLVKLDLLGNRSLSTIREAIRHVKNCELRIVNCELNSQTAGASGDQLQDIGNASNHTSAMDDSSGRQPNSQFTIRNSQFLGIRNSQFLDIEQLPVNDSATLELLRSARTVGCNQLESPAMRHLLAAMQPGDIRDVMKALAMIRPGAASIGMKDVFIRRQRGLEPVPAGHPAVDAILRDTSGVMLYEDDVMLVAAALLGTSLDEGDRFRKAVQKCPDDRERLRLSQEFLGRCRANGVDLEYAKSMWVQMAKFNAYSFCRAHSASYARLAYAVAYFKAHHPLAFWVAALNNNQSMYHPRVYVEEAKRAGIRFLGPDINRSREEFAIEQVGQPGGGCPGVVRVGFNRVDGLGPMGIKAILAGGADRPFQSLSDCLDRTGLGKEEAQALILCGAFDALAVTRPALIMELNLWRPRRGAGRARGGATLLCARPTVIETLDDYSPRRKWLDERRILGISTGEHPLAAWRAAMAERVDTDSRQLRQRVGRRVRIAGLLEAMRDARSQNGRVVRFFTFDDEHSLFEVTAFADACPITGRPSHPPNPAVITGIVEDRYGALTLAAQRIAWHDGNTMQLIG